MTTIIVGIVCLFGGAVVGLLAGGLCAAARCRDCLKPVDKGNANG